MRQITHTYTGNIKYYKFCHTNLFHDGKENTVEPGMDLLLGGGGGVCTPLALARGGAGVLFFMINQNIIRDKMRYSNLSNNMMISEL